MAVTSFGSAHGFLYALKYTSKILVLIVSFIEALLWSLEATISIWCIYNTVEFNKTNPNY